MPQADMLQPLRAGHDNTSAERYGKLSVLAGVSGCCVITVLVEALFFDEVGDLLSSLALRVSMWRLMMNRRIARLFTAAIVFVCATSVFAQPKDTIFDESQVPAYTLPAPLLMEDGTKVDSPEMWASKRRPEILALFEEHVHGRSPAAPDRIESTVTSTDRDALGGKATRKQVTIYVMGDRDGPSIDLLLYVPNDVKKPVPAFLGLNFYGNHTVEADPEIKLSERWMRANASKGVVDHRATEASRGTSASRWPAEMIVDRGYCVGHSLLW